jgi:Lrp/AsnC family leucine-responsive transcriptional regulator
MTTLNFEVNDKLLDDVGWAILKELQHNARIPFSELGRRIGLSSPAVAERVRRMEDAGIIKGYRAEIDLAAVGLPVRAIIRIALFGTRNGRSDAMLQNMPEIIECHRVTGDDCYIMKVAVTSVDHLSNLIDQLATHGQVTTALVLSSPVDGRLLEEITPYDGA